MANYYKPVQVQYHSLEGRQGTENERGLNERCKLNDEGQQKHDWLLLPLIKDINTSAGNIHFQQKQYLICMNCQEAGHL